jgi:GNAT superfamily N-acetyltransferase
MIIKTISHKEVLPIRHQVMWPEKSLDFVKIPGDEFAIHWGGFSEGVLVSVISIFVDGSTAQFRKFATLTTQQGQGLGSQLLQFVIHELKLRGIHSIWCHARIEKVAFYQKFGLEISGMPFEKNGKEYVRMSYEL